MNMLHKDGVEFSPLKMHWIAGDPGYGKSFITLLVDKQRVQSGEAFFVVNPKPQSPKLSDLILEGSKLHPQGFGCWWGKDPQTYTITCSCSLGAAGVAIGSTMSASLARIDLFTVLGWPLHDEPRLPYPENAPLYEFEQDGRSSMRVMAVCGWLNDCARWSREAIAIYLKQYGF